LCLQTQRAAAAACRNAYTRTFSLNTGGDGYGDAPGGVAIAFHCLGHYNVGMDVWVGLHSPGYMYT
jgi:hypothetical protein